MKLSIAGSCFGSDNRERTQEEAEAFAQMIENEAEHDDWVRVLYAVQKPDTVELETLAFKLERTG